MKVNKKLAVAATAAAALVVGVLVATAGRAAASPVPQPKPGDQCVTVVADPFDNAEASVKSDHWADSVITRMTKICKVGNPIVPTPQVATDLKATTDVPSVQEYTATVTDTGPFQAIQGQNVPGPDSGKITDSVHGTLEGGWTADFLAPADWGTWTGVAGDATEGVLYGDGSPDWVRNFFGLAEGQFFEKPHWTFTTCSESWTNKLKGNDNGQQDNPGDITGKGCPSPSPSPSQSATPSPTPTTPSPTPTTPAPTPTTGTGTVTVTG